MSRSDGSTADYYVLPEGATQLQDLISHRNMNAQIGEITRACYRYGLASHSDMLRDAKKIRFYAQAEVERLERLEGNKASANEWIEWAAGECPVPRGTLVDIKDGDGEIHESVKALDHWSNNETHWQHKSCSSACKIVAYRLSKAGA